MTSVQARYDDLASNKNWTSLCLTERSSRNSTKSGVVLPAQFEKEKWVGGGGGGGWGVGGGGDVADCTK